MACLVKGLGGDVRGDLVELTKAGFGLPESPRLWYLEYKDTIEELGLKELVLVPGLFRAFHADGRLRALASIHVDDTRYAGDSTSKVLWEQLHRRLKFGKHRQATEGWQKFCGRWERQSDETFEMQISMQEYIKTIDHTFGQGSCRSGPWGATWRSCDYLNFHGSNYGEFRSDFYINFRGSNYGEFRIDYYINFWGFAVWQ